MKTYDYRNLHNLENNVSKVHFRLRMDLYVNEKQVTRLIRKTLIVSYYAHTDVLPTETGCF